MPGLSNAIALLGVAAFVAAPAVGQSVAEADAQYLDMDAGRLGETLTKLAQKTGVNLLFSAATVGELRNPSVRGPMTIDEAVHRLLAGSGLLFRRTAEGSIIVYSSGKPRAEEPIPEILVIGHRTQNVDIRRTENDIQPYGVATSSEILSAHPDNVGDFLRNRLSSDAQVETAAQDPRGEGGSVRSEVNLYGLGADQTLVLVDGARMPGVPATAYFFQPDVNGLPVTAIDRIESLTATAGGIYGPGAMGGVVNIVLKREYRGADLSINYGLTDRGDAQRRRIDGRIGFTPDGGRTDVMIAFSHSDSGELVDGDRDYVQRSRILLLGQTSLAAFLKDDPSAAAVVVQGTSGVNLQLKAGYGGAVLASPFSYLPIGSGGGNPIASLLANAGKFPQDLSPDGNGTGQSIVSNPETTSVLVNVRHRFGLNIEAFADLIRLEDDGRGVTGVNNQNVVVSNLAATNPFTQSVSLSFPLPGFDSVYRTRLTSTRLSAGLIGHLQHDWKAEGDLTIGGVKERISLSGFSLNADANAALFLGTPGAGGEPALNPFGDWGTFITAIQKYRTPR
ncbi:MAG: TonB-dependent receptor plug domain-containing protein, partial [Janthinobacterium lividum]